jgi:hypothetical protein
VAVFQEIYGAGIDGRRKDGLQKEFKAGFEVILGAEEIDRQNKGNHCLKDTLGQVDGSVDNVVEAPGQQGTERIEETSAGVDQP